MALWLNMQRAEKSDSPLNGTAQTIPYGMTSLLSLVRDRCLPNWGIRYRGCFKGDLLRVQRRLWLKPQAANRRCRANRSRHAKRSASFLPLQSRPPLSPRRSLGRAPERLEYGGFCNPRMSLQERRRHRRLQERAAFHMRLSRVLHRINNQGQRGQSAPEAQYVPGSSAVYLRSVRRPLRASKERASLDGPLRLAWYP